jgi:DNA polymerase
VTTLSIDFETRSTVDLKKAGQHVYAAHPTTDIWCMAWAFDDDEPALWFPSDALEHEHGVPSAVAEYLVLKGEVRAWNAAFERAIWREIMRKRYGAPAVHDDQYVCTAAEAAAMALPRALGQCAAILGVVQQKDDSGHKLMTKMAKPRKKRGNDQLIWWDDPALITQLGDYCKQDVRTERAAAKALRRLTPKERRLYLLDQRINDRGVQLDRPLILAAQQIVARGLEEANATLAHLTGGDVESVMQHERLGAWVNAQGVATDGVSKPAVKELIEKDDLLSRSTLPEAVRAVLELRQEAGRTSVAKLVSMLNCMGADDRARGLLLWHGADTGRWAGRLIQPQNFPRGGEVLNVETFIADVLAGHYDLLDTFYAPIIVVVNMLRSMFTAAPGHDLLAGDFSAIEARVLNWLAGQADVVRSFEQYDSGDKSRDPYKVMAVRMGRAATVADVTYADRQAGKAAELGCGFQMGPKKFMSAAWDVYQVRVSPPEAKAAVKAYRDNHEHVVAFWRDAENAFIAAVDNPGQVQVFGGLQNLRVVVRGGYCYCVLPAGRALCYAAPQVKERTVTIEDEEGKEHSFTKRGFEFMGQDSMTKQWKRQRAYGGYLVENIVQAVARDLLAEAMVRVEDAGYPVVMTVHDEVVSEVAEGVGELDEFVKLLAELPAWAAGCPVSAEGWRGFRYRK